MRLIDPDAVIRFLANIQHVNEGWLFTYEQVKKIVRYAPTIEAEPVRHGRMIEGRYPNDNKCSECGQIFRDDIGFIIQDDDGSFRYPKRCPECGCYWDDVE